MVLMGAVLAVSEPAWDRLYGLSGVVAALSATAFVLALRARRLGGTIAGAATALVVGLAAFPVAVRALPGQRAVPADKNSLEYLARVLPADAVVVTDQASGVSWYSDRVAVWIPQAPPPTPKEGEPTLLVDAADATQAEGYKALVRAGLEPDAIFLSSELRSYAAAEGIGRWQLLHDVIAKQLDALEQGQAEGTPWVPPGWTLAASLPPRDLLLTPAAAGAAEGGGTEAGTAEAAGEND